MYVLDTDQLTFLERGRGIEFDHLIARLRELDAAEIAVTIVSFEEQTRGWLAYLARARTLAKQVEAYSRLARMIENYRVIPLLAFDGAAAAIYERLARSRLRVGTMDLKIASITLAHDATLITRNLADFRKVPGLSVEDWTG